MPFPSYFRMQNWFDPNSQINDPYGNVNFGQPDTNFMQKPQEDNIFQQIMKNYQPREDAMNAYVQQLQNAPRRENYQPSRMRNIASILAGLGAGGPTGITEGQVVGYHANPEAAFNVSRAIRDEPYNRALGDWETRNKPLLGAAQQEQARNVNERQLMLGELTRVQNEQRIRDAELKSSQIYDTKIKDMQRKTDEAEKDRDLARQKFEADQTNKDNLLILHKAELAALNARHDLDNAQREKLHETEKAKWEAQTKNNQDVLELRNKQLEQANQPTTTETTTTTPPGWFAQHVFGAKPTEVKTVTSTKTRGSTQQNQNQRPTQLTSPDGKKYDITKWSDKDIEEARKRGYK